MWGKRNSGQVSFPKRATSPRQSGLSGPAGPCFRVRSKKKKSLWFQNESMGLKISCNKSSHVILSGISVSLRCLQKKKKSCFCSGTG